MSGTVKSEAPVVQEFRLFSKIDPSGKKHFHIMKLLSGVDLHQNFRAPLRLFRDDPRALLRQSANNHADSVTDVGSGVGAAAQIRGGPLGRSRDSFKRRYSSFASKSASSSTTIPPPSNAGNPPPPQNAAAQARAEAYESQAQATQQLAPIGLTFRQNRFMRKRERYLQSKARYERGIAAYNSAKSFRRRRTAWVLEEDDGNNSYLGQLEGGMTSNYAVFLFENNSFHMFPADKWYRFQKKHATSITSTEDAEARQRARERQLEKFSIGTLKLKKSEDDGDKMDIDGGDNDGDSFTKIKVERDNDFHSDRRSSLSNSGKDLKRILGVNEGEDDDDDPYANAVDDMLEKYGNNDDEATDKPKKNVGHRLSSSNASASVSMSSSRNLSEAEEDYNYDEDMEEKGEEDEEDAEDTDDLSDEDLDELEAKLDSQTDVKLKGKRPLDLPLSRSGSQSDLTQLKRTRTAEEPLNRMATSSPISTASSPSTPLSAVATPSSGGTQRNSATFQASMDITEGEVRRLLAKGPMRLKDLLSKLARGDRMNSERNKLLLKNILKKIVDMKLGEGPGGQKDHFLTLKKA